MIELKGSRFTRLLPENLASQRETRALACAVGRQIDKLLALADRALVYAALDKAPEPLLDHLAVELRTPSYRQSYPLETKRALVKGTLPLYAKMGTPAAVEQIVGTIFQGGRVEEFFEYGGQPHHFRATAEIQGVEITAQEMDELRRMIDQVKRLSSWLDEISTTTPMENAALRLHPVRCGNFSITPLPDAEPEFPGLARVTLGAGQGSFMATRLPEPDFKKKEETP